MSLLHIYDDIGIKELYHQARLGNLASVDMTIAVEKESQIFSNNADYFYFIELNAKDIHNNENIYKSPELKLTVPEKLVEKIDCKLLEQLVLSGATYSLSSAVMKIAGDLSGFGCAVKYGGEPYCKEILDKNVVDARNMMDLMARLQS